MTKFSVEAKVGVFVVIGMIILAYMSTRVGRIQYTGDRGYEVYAYFDSAEGIVKGGPVEIAGVEIGHIKDISLEAGKAKVLLRIDPKVRIGEDTEAVIRTKGVLGDKYVELVLGAPNVRPIKPGGRIERTQSPANIDNLLRQLSSIGTDVKEITQSLSGILGGEEGEASLKIIIDNFRELAETLNEMAQKNKVAVREIVDNFRQTSDQLRETIVAFNQITEKINRGEGTIGKLINEEETVDNINAALTSINDYLQKEERFRTYVDYRGEYLFDSNDMKSYLSLRIQPKEDKYYLLQLVDDPAGKKTVTETTTTTGGGSPTTEYREEIEKDELKFSAQIAKRYYNLGLRGGLFESTGGVGADYYFLDDRLILSLEAFDFDPDRNPHLKFKADFTPLHYIYITGGFDDFISDEGRDSVFVGAGLRFSDEDLKTLLSDAPIPTKK